MSIRKREWTTARGERRESWLVDYRDNAGKRRAKQFPTKKTADAFRIKTESEVVQGIHTADGASITVAEAGEKWLARCAREGLEVSTIKAYTEHFHRHILGKEKREDPPTSPIAGTKLNQLTRPTVEGFRDWLIDHGRSRAMAKRVLGDLSAIVKEAMRLGYVARNVAHGVTVKRSGRDKPKIIPPTKKQMRDLVVAAKAVGNEEPMALPILLTLLFAGLRASELRALPWRNVDLKAATIRVDQRADYQNTIGPPKSQSGFRTIPVPPSLVAALTEWKLRCPPCALDLVFPSSKGMPIYHPNLTARVLDPLLKRAKLEGKFTLHDFRHGCASMWIEKRVQPKRVQTWMGHHSIQVTFDTYGHLFAAIEDDAAIMAALEADVLGDGEAHDEAA